jgi:hypothetical protein
MDAQAETQNALNTNIVRQWRRDIATPNEKPRTIIWRGVDLGKMSR